jgi:hypothetical protein
LHSGLPFGDLFAAAELQALLCKHDVRFASRADHIYNPVLTLWGLFGQCLSLSKDCAAVVICVAALRIAFYLDPCSAATGAYCIARSRIPIPFLTDLAYLLGERLEDRAPAAWRWHGRRTLLVDGTTLSGPDTAANQEKYPQSRSQKPGLGFPLIRLVVIVGLATGALLGAATAPWRGKGNGETSLLRRLFDRLRAGDLLVADRAYGVFPLVALLWRRGVDVCFRVQQQASVSSAGSRARRLGKGDYLVEWGRPQRPDWMDKDVYGALPAVLQLREVHTQVNKPGFRSKHVVVVTTLTALDAKGRPLIKAADIRELYRKRWNAELDIRSIKAHMGMDILGGQTPEMMEREIWAHLATYNLIRRLQAAAALGRGCQPRQLSFAAAQNQLRQNQHALSTYDDARYEQLARAMVKGAAVRVVGKRPDRYEPRRRKRREKDGKLLTVPREQARRQVAAGAEANQPKTRRKKKSQAPAGQQAAAQIQQ